MAFTHTKFPTDAGGGGKGYASGEYQNDGGSTGGAINTGLREIEFMFLQPIDAAVVNNQPAINATLINNDLGKKTLAGPNITIVTDASQNGTWFAIGH